uniref:Uncharacterized protein n=1 Tax=Cannabis sativa TaxID=3483 RepID=A0A803PQC3_CANSA
MERYARTVHHEPNYEVLAIKERDSKQLKLEEPAIAFTKRDAAKVRFPRNDPLVITTMIGNMTVVRRSNGGYAMFLEGNFISWFAKKQHVVARSSTESEFSALTNVVAKMKWLVFLLSEL